MKSSRAIFRGYGKPEEVLEVESVGLAAPGDGEVVLRWLAAPINPADVNYVEGVYGVKPKLPSQAGMEGVALVEACGAGVKDLREGQAVVARRRLNSWASHGLANEGDLWVIPEDLVGKVAWEQWAQLRINPLTAWQILEGFVKLGPGQRVMQNAANSSVGQVLIQLARARGVQTVNFARRQESLDELKGLDPDSLYFLDTQEGWAQAKAELGDDLPVLASNSVGGDSGLNQLKLLAKRGKQVTYGAMARQPSRLPAGLLIFKELQLTGFWVSEWQKRASKAELDAALLALAQTMAAGELKMPVEQSFELSELKEAVSRAQQGHRQGKILLRLGSTDGVLFP